MISRKRRGKIMISAAMLMPKIYLEMFEFVLNLCTYVRVTFSLTKC